MDMSLFSEIQELASAAQSCAQAAQQIRDAQTAMAPTDPAMPVPAMAAGWLPPGLNIVSAVTKPVRDALTKGMLTELDAGVKVALEEIQKRLVRAGLVVPPA